MAEGSGSLYDPRRHVRILSERVRDVSSVDYPGHFPGEDHSWDLAKFTEVRWFSRSIHWAEVDATCHHK